MDKADTRPTGPVFITICSSCRPPDTPLGEAPGRKLLAAARAAGIGVADVKVREVQCLSVCTRICAASLSAEGGYTFVYGDLDPDTGAAALVELAAGCRDSAYGFVAWKDRPEPLRRGMIARVPPPGWSPDGGGTPA